MHHMNCTEVNLILIMRYIYKKVFTAIIGYVKAFELELIILAELLRAVLRALEV